jgi:Family of unknown function (DUF5372)
VTATLPEAVVITRPRHPLQGRELRVLGGMRRHGRLELLLVLPDGSKSLVPAAWTGAAAESSGADEDAGQAAAAATVGRLGDLLAACALVSAISARNRDDREQAARKPPTKEDTRAAYPAQSAGGPGSGATGEADSPAPRSARRRGGHAAGQADGPGRRSRRTRRDGSRGGGGGDRR